MTDSDPIFASLSDRTTWRPQRSRGFTLIEVMVVVGIAAVLMSIAVPAFVRRLSPQSMQRAVADVVEACGKARSHAILNGVTTALRIHPGDRIFVVVVIGKAMAPPPSEDGGVPSVVPNQNQEVLPPGMGTPVAGGGGIFSATLDPAIRLNMLFVNKDDLADEPAADVFFYSNGTCDEMFLILISDKNEQREIDLEAVTALATVESDIQKGMMKYMAK